ncbi:HepT-like ribonuclease domain-containing protein [Chromatium okenii]|jgi:hypothetical protein|uniref:DUF86 domain-containing protein n=1 Tax=Chromatium okenii TaxID=61644 RepID=A0A2S7XTZ0_9GAMM|nr:HepT-like ribonuclease domain-containing protein [Chromatium okenii]MBV5311214.1 hypothetical protein [Chromatium okenii]PQJ97170.1 hypothetical protein CXB77_04245 [Chromatium okenii]
MNPEKIQWLRGELVNLESAATHLQFSLERSQQLIHCSTWALEELERLESLTSRFARLADLLIQRVMRLIDELELTPQGTVLDRIQRAEKRGWMAQAGQLVQIRELRNLIAHEYANDKMPEIYRAVVTLTPVLLAAIPQVKQYSNALISRYDAGIV